MTPAPQRPLAVGFFGLVYRGKGFELIGRIRELLSDDVAIRVAGRGTEQLTPAPGIDIVGGVEGAEEDAFFESVRAVVVPYGRRTFYGPAYPSSAVVTHAIGYGTPVICSDHGALVDLDQRHGADNDIARGAVDRYQVAFGDNFRADGELFAFIIDFDGLAAADARFAHAARHHRSVRGHTTA